MTKAELIERIIDTFTDMGSEDPGDTALCNPIMLDEATLYLGEYRRTERENFKPSEWLPAEVTPELYMEAYNCYIQKCKYDVTAERLAEYIADGELIYTFNEFIGEYHNESDKLVYPTDFLNEDIEFPFTEYDLTMLDLINIGQNSPDFDMSDDYCWFDNKNNQMHSTDTPFADGLIDATAFAKWILEDKNRIEQIQNGMDNTQIDYVFRYWG